MCVHAKSLQPCPTLCNPMDCSPKGSSVHGILQARKLEWVVVPFSRGSSWPGIEPTCLMFPAFVGGFFTTRASWQVQWYRLTDFQGRNKEEDVKKRLVDMGGWGRGRSGWDELREQHWHMYSAMWISLEDIRLSESRFHLCEMSRIGKTTRTEKLVVA